MNGNLKEKTAKGLGWGFADSIAGTGVTALISIVLARLLSPAEFGLIGMTTIFMSLANSLVDSGFSGALTRKLRVDDKDYNTVFYTNLSISVLIYICLYFIAPYIASFLKTAILSDIIRVLGLSVILYAFAQIQKVILIRAIDFKKQALISLVASSTSGIIGIAMAIYGYGVWSLVFQQLSNITISSSLLWITSSWKPSFTFSLSRFKEMFSFGGNLLITAIISSIWAEIYSLVIGKVYNAGFVGLYSRADKFKNMIASNISIVVQRVTYPVLSKVQEEKERQVRVFRKVVKTSILLTSTLLFGLLACSKSLVLVLIGEQWLPAVDYLKILCIAGLFFPQMTNCVNVINADGHSNITLKLQIIKVLFAIIPILLGIYLSVSALLWGLALVSAITFIIHAYYVSQIINYSVKTHLLDCIPAIIASIIMGLIVWSIELLSLPILVTLTLQILIGAIITIFTYEKIIHCEEYIDIKNTFLQFIK